METSPNPDLPPRPVIAITPRSPAVTAVLICLLLGGLGAGAWSLINPSFFIETEGESTTYRVSPESIERTGAFLAVTVAGALELLLRRRGSRRPGGEVIALVVALVMFLPLWHQYRCRVVVTADGITVPLIGGLLPGAPTTFRFANLSTIYLKRTTNRSTRQVLITKKNQQIEIDLGSMAQIVADQIESCATLWGTRVIIR